MRKEQLKKNNPKATLFVGVGGIGSKIIRGVAERAMKDNTDSIRFVVMDTDANDLGNLRSGNNITTVQTSSPRSVKDYLENDAMARRDWFPENRILDDKTVSEGAGQVRSISRLALNACIKQNEISKLYKAIDELFLKDGRDLKQAMRVVIASTAAGGTGSGIAMMTGMLIRQYIKEKYPESAAIIRGLIILPGVMDTVIETQTEREGLRRNGYATIKEINAFMVKGSGFCDSVKELERYSDLNIVLPTTASGTNRLENLPFDFCFLVDRQDDNQGSMPELGQYINSCSQSLYEQNIGPLSGRAFSQEDNIIKEFLNPENMGRNRFGGIGSSILRYPYGKIRDYIAYLWALECIVGRATNGDEDENTDAIINTSWSEYDEKYKMELHAYETNPGASLSDKPTLGKVYIDTLNTSQDRFSETLRKEYLLRKDPTPDSGENIGSKMDRAVMRYIKAVVSKAVETIKRDSKFVMAENDYADDSRTFSQRLSSLENIQNASCDYAKEIAKNFAKSVFYNRERIEKSCDDYMPEALFKNAGVTMHPNAVRYLLYKLRDALNKEKDRVGDGHIAAFNDGINDIKGLNPEDRAANEKKFSVVGNMAKEATLREMCAALDDTNNLTDKINSESKRNCAGYLETLYEMIKDQCSIMATLAVCEQGLEFVQLMIDHIEDFYRGFDDKVRSLKKWRKDIVSDLEFHKGDCLRNVCATEAMMDVLSSYVSRPSNGELLPANLNAKIFNALKENIYLERQKSYDPFAAGDKKDIFDEILLDYFRETVDSTCADVLDMNILQALAMEFKIDRELANDKDNEGSKVLRDRYITDRILNAENLAAPGIGKNDFDERREVKARGYNDGIVDGEGIRISDYLPKSTPSSSISKYEIHFFRALYNVTPTQLSKFCSNVEKDENGNIKIVNDYDGSIGGGEYFKAYQKYMENIGPDCKKNSVITPHADKRWDSISVMPELDLNYQKVLMINIHQAFFYGFLYGIITYDAFDQKMKNIYRYENLDGDIKKFTVSNKTECDELYEVLDALYFDRAAVKSIHRYALAKHIKDKDKHSPYEKTSFARGIENLTDNFLVGGFDKGNEKTSVFEIPLMYFNSLPPKMRDDDEIVLMVNSIFDAISNELSEFEDPDKYNGHLAKILTEQYELLVENYKKEKNEPLRNGMPIKLNFVVTTVYKRLVAKLEQLDIQDVEEEVIRLKKLIK